MTVNNDNKAFALVDDTYPINDRTSLFTISNRWQKPIEDTVAILKESGFTFFVKDGYDVSTAVAARLVDEDYIDGGVPDLWDLSGAKKLTEVEVDLETISKDGSLAITAKQGRGFLKPGLYFDSEYTSEHLKVISASTIRFPHEVFIKGDELDKFEKEPTSRVGETPKKPSNLDEVNKKRKLSDNELLNTVELFDKLQAEKPNWGVTLVRDEVGQKLNISGEAVKKRLNKAKERGLMT